MKQLTFNTEMCNNFTNFLKRAQMGKPGLRIPIIFLAVFLGMFLFTSEIYPAKPIAKISGFKGDVLILSGKQILKVRHVGRILYQGDRIQTKQGQVQITFNDGAVLKVRPYTNTSIREREEKRGFWIFKTKKTVRRITCFVGKLWFKSGASKRKNFLQTPTAVCGVRGSDGDIGFDGINSYLNMYSGEAGVVGKILRGFFADPGVSAAIKNRVYQTLEKAHRKTEQAKATGKAVDRAKAKVEALKVVKVAAIELQKNPDKAVKKEAEITSVAADATIAAAMAKVVVEEIKEAKKAAEKAAEKARAAGNHEAAEKAEKAAEKAEVAAERAEVAAEKAEVAAERAEVAAEKLDLEKTMEAAVEAIKISEDVTDIGEEIFEIIQEVAPIFQETQPEEVSPEETQPKEAPPEEKPPEEEESPPGIDTETSEQEIYQEESEVSPSQ